ncbi:unnamed protein product [Mytilus coruscus]|uniref:Uncharacterized protein n=1 Tax=Mytilus coruscus TaxID=42192 RepID=A0A6J8A830_MYTCO|nr:unnamed protein product [Mytilus coruscus]
MSSITTSARKYKQSQMKVKRASQPPPPSYQELLSDNNSTFGAFCFTEDDRMVVEESVLPEQSNWLIHCLRIFDLKTYQSKQIKLSDRHGINMNTGSICIYDATLALLASNTDIRGVKVIDKKLQRICRTIYPRGSNSLGKIYKIKWLSCKDGKLFLWQSLSMGNVYVPLTLTVRFYLK